MDYISQSVAFKLRKVVRYFRLYGPRRVLAKVRGQYHLKKCYEKLPELPNAPLSGGSIGFIGCGNYAFSTIAYFVAKTVPGQLRAAMDLNVHRAASLGETYGLRYYTDDAEKVISDSEIKLVYIASNHSTHAEYAIRCIDAGKSVFIEKPHVVSRDQLDRLTRSIEATPRSKVFLGFNRPKSYLVRKLKELLANQSGPAMINWFVVGHDIPEGHWYHGASEGGRVLGNLCHWTDLTLDLVTVERAFPCTIVPATPRDESTNLVVSAIFADRSCATITFSAKGHTFEGVREVLNLHKGDLIATLIDFQKLTVDVVEKRLQFSTFYRDHGHEANIVSACRGLEPNGPPGETLHYVRATALFFLAIKEAIESGHRVVLTREDVLDGDDGVRKPAYGVNLSCDKPSGTLPPSVPPV